ncbi:hypothetical protein ACG83_40295 [Frankia sp. R43]|uniref:AAA family ATPase n=1 Tax=Frankia sp. R43 TaxID=269536 RepID=UPI0006DA9C37|nr:hypothetical protein [Frankia sp. R43]KPM50427.1 hypothetical protein ACG83_40295 [Frankia sp. R43]
MPLAVAVPLLGPPAVGKSTLASQLGQAPECTVFRLREQVPTARLAATAGGAGLLAWMDDATVMTALHRYLTRVVHAPGGRTVIFDNFPGSDWQVRLLLRSFGALAPDCHVLPVELSVDAVTLRRRAVQRRVCPRCERDPARDPRLPAEASDVDAQRCGRCGGVLQPRRGDAPRLLHARLDRYQREGAGIRNEFAAAGIPISPFDTTGSVSDTTAALSALVTARSTHR